MLRDSPLAAHRHICRLIVPMRLAVVTAVSIVLLATQSALSTHHLCPFSNIDVAIIFRESDLPLVSLALHSLSLNMPCHGTLHLISEPANLKKAFAWIGFGITDKVKLHDFEYPDAVCRGVEDMYLQLHGGCGYFMQQWYMLGIDRIMSDSAHYIMLFDPDSILAMPVTCASLFDENGRVKQWSWSIEPHKQFKEVCSALIGVECKQSFMTSLPQLYPRSMFKPLRDHISNIITPGVYDFDAALIEWAQRPRNISQHNEFSQFVIMGNYLKYFMPNISHTVHCPHAMNLYADPYALGDSSCRDFVPIGFHYGWRNVLFMNYAKTLKRGNYARYYHEGDDFAKQCFSSYNGLFGPKTVDAVTEILLQAYCLREYLETGNKVHSFCTAKMVSSIHEEVNIYGPDSQPNFDVVKRVFTPDPPGTLCPNALY
jgi:hypothetical protein